MCEKTGKTQFTNFLCESEIAYAEKSLFKNNSVECVFFGGYEEAERKICMLFPKGAYFSGGECSENSKKIEDFPISAVFVKGSGFKKFSHRDILGSLMSLGIKREVVGDIIISENMTCATVFVVRKMCDFVIEKLQNVSGDKVTCLEKDLKSLEFEPRKFKETFSTVASMRLDAVLCACLDISRDESEKIINREYVSINHEVMTKKDFICSGGSVISVKKHGRYLIESSGEKNKKGRVKIKILKYI